MTKRLVAIGDSHTYGACASDFFSYPKYVAKAFGFDENYPIVPSYTYNAENLDKLIAITDEKYHKNMIEYDNLDPAIACHWGPNAYGYIFVGDENIL